MATTNYTPITHEQIDASLGRNTCYGEEGKVYLSKYDDGFITSKANILSTNEAIDLLTAGKVWGMSSEAENALKTAVEAREAAFDKNSAQSTTEEYKPLNILKAINLRNFQNLVSDGSIFYVEFIKRTTGERRMMRCRTGVKKHLKGGSKGYSAKAKNLLTVFDMNAQGYRSIPVEAIKALTVNGQQFNFAGV